MKDLFHRQNSFSTQVALTLLLWVQLNDAKTLLEDGHKKESHVNSVVPGNPANLQWRRYFNIKKNCHPNCKESEPEMLVLPPPPKPCQEEEEEEEEHVPQPIGFLRKRIICKPKPKPKPVFLKRVDCVCRKKRSVFGPEAHDCDC
ncbi:hypothetical protein CDAR_316951 [Caerostris darwini]|uniref:Uncharacterized protein n=1 Tax=Caerostris darwini TaxID=1538125 RepID=A0AAV4Q4S5_9ARAC|nr:hypothetical protein CDAR_316951 [Caerostris darwini]